VSDDEFRAIRDRIEVAVLELLEQIGAVRRET
jgi:hypothetical protein